jgi:biopolymer transport protein ExbD
MALQQIEMEDPAPVINTTPLIDVMLVLLVMLLVTIPAATHSVNLQMPIGDLAGLKREVVEVEVDFDGTILWNGAVVDSFSQFESNCRSVAASAVPPDVRIRADKRAKYDAVAQVLAMAQRNGVTRLGLLGMP